MNYSDVMTAYNEYANAKRKYEVNVFTDLSGCITLHVWGSTQEDAENEADMAVSEQIHEPWSDYEVIPV